MTLPETWPPEVELAELEYELARERFAYMMSARAEHDGRVCDRELWKRNLVERSNRIAGLERKADEMRARLET